MGHRLADSASPYLLQHRDQPVDWWPWCDQAFDEARHRDVPVFLSVGYATCHWCHVMAHESFDDSGVADVLNRGFVPVKVDREERPDVDQVYMDVCQAVRGRCGWPLTVLLTPDRKPFFVATYLPKEGRMGQPGLIELLHSVGKLWRERRDEVVAAADGIVDHVRPELLPEASGALDATVLHRAAAELAGRHDAVHGGFGPAPKFPVPHLLMFLFRYGRRFSHERSTDMARDALLAMTHGGIHDQLGSGFHRYATDAEWKLPHFEKMLYDQAWIVRACAEGWAATGDEELRETAAATIRYVLRDLTAGDGRFFTGEDADSEGEEGRFYLWAEDELDAVLGARDGALARAWFGTRAEGNYADEATGMRTGLNVLHPGRGGARRMPEDPGVRRRIVQRLLEARSGRERPLRDEKILTDWNGMMIAALSVAGRACGEPEWVAAAARAADRILEVHRSADGRLHHRSFGTRTGVPGLLDDYAALADGLLELYQATFRPAYLVEAVRLARVMVERFSAADGTFHLSADDAADLIIRPRPLLDGAVPSGNALALGVIVRIGQLTGDSVWLERADRQLRALAGLVRTAPGSVPGLMLAIDLLVGGTAELVLSGDPGDAHWRTLRTAVDAVLPPWAVVLHRPADGERLRDLLSVVPWVEAMSSGGTEATAYLCRGFTCDAPIRDVRELEERLRIPPIPAG